MKSLSLTIFGVLLAATSSHAAITVFKDSIDFTYLYEMDSDPTAQDLDTNGTSDYFNATASGLTAPNTYLDGVAVSNQSAGTPEILFRTDYGGSIARASLTNANSPWTIEIRVRKTGGAQSTDGWFGIAMQNPGASFSTRVNFEDDRVSYRNFASNNDYLVGTNFADGSFHNVRIAYEGGDSYYVWVNNTLLNADLETGFAGGNGSFNTSGAWFIGDFSGGIGGDWEVDYIRYDAGVASAMIPEPSSMLIFAVAGLGLFIRRRAH